MSQSSVGESITLILVRALAVFLRVLPLSWALAFGRTVGWAASFVVRRRHVSYANLKAAFGRQYTDKQRKRLIRKNFMHLAQNVVEILRFPKMNRSYFETYITPEHRERYDEIVKSKKGSILMTPHFGNWELSQIISAIVGKPLHVLARRQKHSLLDDYLNRLRVSHGSVAILKGRGVRDLIRELEEGGLVGALGDLSGGKEGTPIRFFGRKTTAPSGIFSIARRTDSKILPCFMVRENGPYHRICVEQSFSLTETENEDYDVKTNLQDYYRVLEQWIGKYPDQWLWVYKRWKYCFTKKIVVLKDDRAGHASQAEAIAREFFRLRDEISPEYEFEFHPIEIRFKSEFHRRAFFMLAVLLLPFAQSRIGWLRGFLDSACVSELEEVSADIVISAGSHLAPLNLWLKKENLARSIVVMKPPFPYSVSRFDLAIVPVHDSLSGAPDDMVRTLVSPSRVDEELLRSSGEQLKNTVSLGTNPSNRVSVFIGGKSKAYRLDLGAFRTWIRGLRLFAEKSGCDLLVTTSRRTDAEISQIVKDELGKHESCKLLIIANESNLENAVYGMLALSEVAIVTEDSVSMISDAVRAQRKVLVMQLGNGRLSRKHRRFCDALAAEALVQVADELNFRDKLYHLNELEHENVSGRESKVIREALKRLL